MRRNDTTTLTFYGGLTTIGGVHVLVRRDGCGLLFDFGVPVDRNNLFSPRFQPAPEQMFSTLLYTGMAPPVPAAYDSTLLRAVDEDLLRSVWRRNGSEKEGIPQVDDLRVFVSHIHQDHMALLPYAREGLPVYMHPDAAVTYACVQRAGEYPGTKADIRTLAGGETVRFGPFGLTLVEVDHDTPGASGFILETPEGVIAFTGDWRGHGRHPERMDGFAERCRSTGVSVLITETTMLSFGTTVRTRPVISEVDAVRAMEDTVAAPGGLVYVNILARNLERFGDLVAVCIRQNRYLVTDEHTAAFWHEAWNAAPGALTSHPAFEHVAAHLPDPFRVLAGLEEGGKPRVHGAYRSASLEEVTRHPDHYVYYLPYSQTSRMAEVEQRLAAGAAGAGRSAGDSSVRPESVYFHADGDPLSSDDRVLGSWLKRYGVRYVYSATGGHATQQRIEQFLRAVAPRVVVPVHGRQPSLLHSDGCLRYLPQAGETVALPSILNPTTEGGEQREGETEERG